MLERPPPAASLAGCGGVGDLQDPREYSPDTPLGGEQLVINMGRLEAWRATHPEDDKNRLENERPDGLASLGGSEHMASHSYSGGMSAC